MVKATTLDPFNVARLKPVVLLAKDVLSVTVAPVMMGTPLPLVVAPPLRII